MAAASLQATHAPRKRKPDPARVVQSYYHICERDGRRGALRKCGELYNISDESVRRYVAAHEARTADPEPPELAYVDPPGAYPRPEPLPHIATTTPQIDAGGSGDITSSYGAVPVQSVATAGEPATDEDATRHTPEPEPAPLDSPQLPQSDPDPADIPDLLPTDGPTVLPDIMPRSHPLDEPLGAAVDPYRAAARAAMLTDYRRRMEAQEAADRRRQGLLVRIAHSDYAGFWFGVLVFTGLLALMVWT